MAGIHKSTSPYVNTEILNQYVNYLDIWQTIDIPVSVNDYEYVIENKYDENPARLAYDLYGTTSLFWIFARRNMDTIFDPIGDFKAGTTIMIPSKDTVETIF
jgi:hypothetical protein